MQECHLFVFILDCCFCQHQTTLYPFIWLNLNNWEEKRHVIIILWHPQCHQWPALRFISSNCINIEWLCVVMVLESAEIHSRCWAVKFIHTPLEYSEPFTLFPLSMRGCELYYYYLHLRLTCSLRDNCIVPLLLILSFQSNTFPMTIFPTPSSALNLWLVLIGFQWNSHFKALSFLFITSTSTLSSFNLRLVL